MKKLSAIITGLLLPLFSWGSQPEAIERPVLSAYTLEIGSAHIAETYLSPLRHSGLSLALNYERMQAMRFDPERWVMRLDGRLSLDNTRNNPARNATMLNLDFRLGWSMLRRFNFGGGWSVFAGGSTSANVGVFYYPRNSNNPAAVKASWTVNAVAGAAWNLKIKKLPVCLRYLAEMPLTGIFFQPQYGELYYEIYLGNHKGLVRGAWPGNFFKLNNLLTADLRLGRSIIRLGYRCDITSVKASDIATRHINHSAVIGVASEWLSLSADRKMPSKNSRIISALY